MDSVDTGLLSPLCSQTGGLRTVPCRCRWPHVQCAAPGPNPGSIESIVPGPYPPTNSLSLASHGPACRWLPGKYCTCPPPPPPPARPRKSVVNCLCGGGSWYRVYCTTPSAIISYVHHIQQLTLQVIGGAFHPFRVLRRRPCRKRGRRISNVSSGALCRDACPQSPCSSYCRIVRGGAALYSLFTNLILNCAFLCHLVDEMTSNVVTQLISFYDCLLMKY